MTTPSLLPAVICLVAGCALVLIEALIPGFGLPGIAGGALLLFGAWLLGAAAGAGTAAVVLLILLLLLGAAVLVLFRAAAKGKLDRTRLFLHAPDPASKQADADAAEALPAGARGTAESALRPAGIGVFDGRRVSVVTEGGFIEAGAPIEVLRAEGKKTVVRAASAE